MTDSPIRVCVAGLWHLGTVTAACLAAVGHRVTGFDHDAEVVRKLSMGMPPLFEPGLEDLVRQGLDVGRLRFESDPATALSGAEIVWIAYDTPVDDDDRADVDAVVGWVRLLMPHFSNGTLVLVSSQLPVGTTRGLEAEYTGKYPGRQVSFACSPENLRLGQALRAFLHPDRVIVGLGHDRERERLSVLLRPITSHIEWMSVESAEMTKHAINAFLATSVTFANEIATLCEQVGADAAEVERGLKSEARIGPRAYLAPGAAFAGGTLARDVVFLSALARSRGLGTHLLAAVKTSNDVHRGWALRRLEQDLGGVAGKTVAVWGLTYKPGTNTLRRSSALELCGQLVARGAHVRAHDPVVEVLPHPEGSGITLCSTPLAAVEQADALVVATPWPAYREVDPDRVRAAMHRCLVIDANRFLGGIMAGRHGVDLVSVGRAGR